MAEAKENGVQPPIVLVPGVGSSYRNGWRQLWKYFLELFLIGIIGIVIGVPSGMGGGEAREGVAAVGILGVLGFIYSILVVSPTEYGISFAYIKAARGDKLIIKDMFEAFRNYWNVVLANLLVGIIVLIGLFLLIIPGIIFACKLAFTPYLVVDQKMEVIEAVKESWRMTNGYAWKVFLIGLLGIPISIAGLLCLGVGIIVAIMWITLASASLYHSVSVRDKASMPTAL
ncbi:YciC family protein [Chloroflexota bacterium]